MTTNDTTKAEAQELEILLEAARRANWDALHGPRHLRSGRYNPCGEGGHGADEAARLPAAAAEPRIDPDAKPDPSGATRREP